MDVDVIQPFFILKESKDNPPFTLEELWEQKENKNTIKNKQILRGKKKGSLKSMHLD